MKRAMDAIRESRSMAATATTTKETVDVHEVNANNGEPAIILEEISERPNTQRRGPSSSTSSSSSSISSSDRAHSTKANRKRSHERISFASESGITYDPCSRDLMVGK